MRSIASMLVLSLISLSTVATAQSDTHQMSASKAPAQKSAAAIAFDLVKGLAGEWEGPVTTDMPEAAKALEQRPIHVSMRVTSRGNVVVHEFQIAGTPLDASKYDHPVTMLYLDTDRLNLIHYCDAGNRPRMTGTVSPDRKSIDFEFAELSGGDAYGHMHHLTVNVIDQNHHVEDWTFKMPGNKTVHARFDLRRQPAAAGPANGTSR